MCWWYQKGRSITTTTAAVISSRGANGDNKYPNNDNEIATTVVCIAKSAFLLCPIGESITDRMGQWMK
jgi:hypothetical protein